MTYNRHETHAKAPRSDAGAPGAYGGATHGATDPAAARFVVQWPDPETGCPASRFYTSHDDARRKEWKLTCQGIPAVLLDLEER